MKIFPILVFLLFRLILMNNTYPNSSYTNPFDLMPLTCADFGFMCSRDLGFQMAAAMQSSRTVLQNAELCCLFFRRNTPPALGLFFNSFRHSSSLKWLLIVAGDIELNPGPTRTYAEICQSNSPGENRSPPSKRRNLDDAYACACKSEDGLDSDFLCVTCFHAYHEQCLRKLYSPDDFNLLQRESFECKYCKIEQPERFAETGPKNTDEAEIKRLRMAYSACSRRCDTLLLQEKCRETATVPPSNAKQSSPPQTGSMADIKIRIVKGTRDALSNFWAFTFVFRGIVFDSAEKAFQYFRAMRHKEFGVCRRILAAASPVEAKWIGGEITCKDEQFEDDFPLMVEIVQEKAKQCKSFRDELRKLRGTKILHSTYENADRRWTTGLYYKNLRAHYGNFDGFNAFGYILEYVREQLAEESEYETEVNVVEKEGCVYIQYDGESVSEPPRRQGCYACGQFGHIARNCFNRGRRRMPFPRQEYYRNSENGQLGRIFHNSAYGYGMGPRRYIPKQVPVGNLIQLANDNIMDCEDAPVGECIDPIDSQGIDSGDVSLDSSATVVNKVHTE
jgi:ribA/ribD-fused uncharacterized protein